MSRSVLEILRTEESAVRGALQNLKKVDAQFLCPEARLAGFALVSPHRFRQRRFMQSLRHLGSLFVLISCFVLPRPADAADPQRVAPPSGIALPAEDRAELRDRTDELGALVESLPAKLRNRTISLPRPEAGDLDNGSLPSLIPDAAIYHKAVDWALRYDEFFRSNEVSIARRLLDHGFERARALAEGKAPWLSATGLVVRAYVSKIDGSIQPYGLVVPASYGNSQQLHRLDVWLHGRDNHLTELKFIDERERSPGEFTPPDTLVMHPYGRYCNAFKFAGEVDVLEALEHARSQYAVDDRRVSIRGFSMGGAGVWHLAVHHPALWAGAAPGAGFAETEEYSGILRRQPELPWYERTLWHWYDATDFAANLFHCPTIAYSGEIDKQKQAADIMARAMKEEGLDLVHLIGPKTGHKYEPATKLTLSRRFDAVLGEPKNLLPDELRFTTWTLRYPRAYWIALEGLEHHWRRARVQASVAGEHSLRLETANVSALTVNPLPVNANSDGKLTVEVDGQALTVAKQEFDRADGNDSLRLVKRDGRWRAESLERPGPIRKRPGLQGPIDDAFLDRFIMVRPTATPLHERTGDWVQARLADALVQWRAKFRGDAIVKDDVDVTAEEMATSHLILWGDPQSNRLIGRILSDLPLEWDAEALRLGTHEAATADHVPILIYPNPLQPDRYVVLNSGFTFSEAGRQSNALQTPKLPDWAILAANEGKANSDVGQVMAAGFFDENWRWTGEKF